MRSASARHHERESSSALPAGVFAVVPALNEASQIASVVEDLRAAGAEVVVIDDGSVDGTDQRAGAAGATVLRHAINRGQGAALQTGFKWALARGAQWIVTFDSDGQHTAADLPRLLDPLFKNEADVVLGSRFLGSTEGLTAPRRVILKLATIFTRMATGLRVTDAHNGLRAFSRNAAAALHLRLDRMAHASELMDQIRSSEMRITEVPVSIRYTDYSRRKGQRSSGAFRVLFDYLLYRWMR
jgi:polyprenyl-phospho-N-acetylgalactosaminyl synthase